MIAFDARRPLGTITKIVVTFVILLAPFSAPAQNTGPPGPDVCAQPVLPDSGSSLRTMNRSVEAALDRALRKINASKYADARASVGQLELDRLTPYELAMTEGVLFRIADGERKYDEARQHLVRAIESCGLTDQGIAKAQDAINRVDADARLATVTSNRPENASPRAPARTTSKFRHGSTQRSSAWSGSQILDEGQSARAEGRIGGTHF